MVQRVLETQQWLDRWESAARDAGKTPDELASLLFVAAALMQHEPGLWLVDLCVDANRKLGCSHGELAFALGNSAQRMTAIQMGKAH